MIIPPWRRNDNHSYPLVMATTTGRQPHRNRTPPRLTARNHQGKAAQIGLRRQQAVDSDWYTASSHQTPLPLTDPVQRRRSEISCSSSSRGAPMCRRCCFDPDTCPSNSTLLQDCTKKHGNAHDHMLSAPPNSTRRPSKGRQRGGLDSTWPIRLILYS